MRAVTLGYTYRPGASKRAAEVSSPQSLSWGAKVKLALKVVLVLLVLGPWFFSAYRLWQLKGLRQEIAHLEALKAKQEALWHSLTEEKVVRAKVAPLGLHKPSPKEVIHLP